MKKIFLITFCLLVTSIYGQSTINYVEVSKQLLENIKNKNAFDKQVAVLEESTLENLVNQLKTDDEKIAFWVNIYNAFIQISLTENPEAYNDKGAYFKKERVKIAGELLSFDDIEHDILRKSRIKISLGYLRKWFRPKWERKLRVNDIDWRIHFALNCGAKSCPPVAIYSAENLDKEFDFMTTKFLNDYTTYNAESKTAETVALFSWFRGDFGGLCGAKKILFKYKITPEKPKNIDFKKYDWTLSLDNYREIPE